MENESEKVLSPHEQYKQFNKEVKRSNKEKNGDFDAETDNMIDDVVDELAELGEEVEKKELDKNMGTEKISFTREDYIKDQQKKFDHHTAEKITSIAGMRASKLSPKDQIKMKKVLTAFTKEKITDNLLLHLVKKKIMLHEEVETHQKNAKKLQLKLLNELTQLTDRVVKSQGALEVFNKDILDYIQENPKLIK